MRQEPEPPPKLTERQRRFVDEYVRCGNGAAAARAAGYKTKGNAQAARLLQRPNVAAAVESRNAELANAKVASARERQEFWTSAMRGEVKGISFADRLKASELLAKSKGDFIDRREIRSLSLAGTLDWDAVLRGRRDPANGAPAAIEAKPVNKVTATQRVTQKEKVIDAEPVEDQAAQVQAEEANNDTLPPEQPALPPRLRLASPPTAADLERRARETEDLCRKIGL